MAERKWTDWITSPWQSIKGAASDVVDGIGKWITKKVGDTVEGAARERLGPVADMLLPAPAGGTGSPAPTTERAAGAPAPAPAAGAPAPAAGTPSPAASGGEDKPWYSGIVDGFKKLFNIGVDTSTGEKKEGFDWGKMLGGIGKFAKDAAPYALALGAAALVFSNGGGILAALLTYAVAMLVATPLVKAIGNFVSGPSGGKSQEVAGKDGPAHVVSMGGQSPVPVKATAPGKDGKVDVDPPSAGGVSGVVATAVAYAKSGYNKAHAFVKGLPTPYYNVIDMLEDRGFTKEQAAGAVANLHQESRLDPYAVGDGGQAKGIAQWHAPRQAEFKKRYGHAIDDRSVGADRLLREQVDFIVFEMTAGTEQAAGRKFLATKSAAEAGAVFSKDYERPAAVQTEANNRAASAEAIYAAAIAKAKAGGTPSPTVDTTGTQVSGAGAPLSTPSSAVAAADKPRIVVTTG